MKTKLLKKSIIAAMAAVILLPSLVALLPPQLASASQPGANSGGDSVIVGQWQDHSTLILPQIGSIPGFSGATFFDSKIDTSLRYVIMGQTDSCTIKDYVTVGSSDGSVKDGADPANANKDVVLHYYAEQPDPGSYTGALSCQGNTMPITMTQVSNFMNYFDWVNAGTIQRSDKNGDLTFTNSDGTGTTFSDPKPNTPVPGSSTGVPDICFSTISTGSIGATQGTLTIDSSDHSLMAAGWPDGSGGTPNIANAKFDQKSSGFISGCTTTKGITIGISNPVNAKGQPASSIQPVQCTGGTIDNATNTCKCPKGQTDNSGTCEATPSTSPECGSSNTSLSWIICPIFDIVAKSADTMNNIVTSLLKTNTCPIFGSSDASGGTCDSSTDAASSAAYHGAWSSMRDIALLFIIIAGLVMVIAQAVGSKAVDAYTIKSVMPRLLIAGIAIALSWILLQFIVDFTNVLGEGVRTLIYAPFSSLANASGNTSLISGGVGSIAGTLLGGAIVVGVSVILLLSFAGTIALGLLIGLIVLILRQIVVTFLLVMAPIAIAAYCLPNTQKLFSMWWDSFFKALLMFPIITGFIAIGRVFAMVSLADTSHNLLSSIIAIFAYIIPFFLLPFTYKMAGGAMGSIAQGIHGAAEPLRKGLSRRRSARWQARGQKAKAGELFSESSRFKSLNRASGRMNKITAGAGNGGFMGAYGLNRLGKSRVGNMKMVAQEEKLKQPGVNRVMQDDDTRMALMAEGGREEAKRLLEAKHGVGSEKVKDALARADAIGFGAASKAAAWGIETTSGKGRALNFMAGQYGRSYSAQMNHMVDDVAKEASVDADNLREESMYSFGGNGRGDLRQKSVGEVLDNKFDANIAGTATADAITGLGTEMVSRLSSGTHAAKMQAAAQMLATEESRPRMSEPTRTAWTTQMGSAGVDYSSQDSVELQLARQVDPAAAASYDAARSHVEATQDALRKAQREVDDAVARSGAGSGAAAAASALRDTARANHEAAVSYLQPHQETLTKLATEIRATSSTYGSTTPRAAREDV